MRSDYERFSLLLWFVRKRDYLDAVGKLAEDARCGYSASSWFRFVGLYFDADRCRRSGLNIVLQGGHMGWRARDERV